MTTTYSIQTRDGRTITRRSEARYVAASVTDAGRVRFHTTDTAARKAAGRFGYVVAIASEAASVTTADHGWVVYDADGNEVGRYDAEIGVHAIKTARAEGHRAVRAVRAR